MVSVPPRHQHRGHALNTAAFSTTALTTNLTNGIINTSGLTTSSSGPHLRGVEARGLQPPGFAMKLDSSWHQVAARISISCRACTSMRASRSILADASFSAT